jgi:hypothetical protein
VRDYDPLNDINSRAPECRFSHLDRYMTERRKSSKLLLIAEAGYQGAKFSGCAMTSERRFLPSGQDILGDGITFFSEAKHRTSRPMLSNGKCIPE